MYTAFPLSGETGVFSLFMPSPPGRISSSAQFREFGRVCERVLPFMQFPTQRCFISVPTFYAAAVEACYLMFKSLTPWHVT